MSRLEKKFKINKIMLSKEKNRLLKEGVRGFLLRVTNIFRN